MTNCDKQRCYWNGQLNSGECGCTMANVMSTKEYAISSTADCNLLQQLEDGKLDNLATRDAKYIADRLQAYAGQDRIFRLINKMVATSK